jgi:PadR family transcriptional regulator, regulatory protein PadR
MNKRNSHRHIAAYLLLLLSKQNLYGAALLNMMREKLPFVLADSAVIYRTMKDLEKEGSVKSSWETDDITGPARKWYEITDKGKQKLSELAKDIEMRKKNFEYFLDEYYNMLKT